MKSDSQAFAFGYMIAVANIVHTTGDLISACEVMREGGFDRRSMEELDLTDFDLNVLNRIFDRLADDE